MQGLSVDSAGIVHVSLKPNYSIRIGDSSGVGASSRQSLRRAYTEHGLSRFEMIGPEADRSADPIVNDPVFWELLYCDQDGATYAVSGYSVQRLDADTVLPLKHIDTAIAFRAYDLCRQRCGAWWLASNMGLYRFHQGRETRFSGRDDLPSSIVRAVCEDTAGSVWAATDKGVAVLRDTGWAHFTSANGLCNNRCTDITADRHGRVWIGTVNGLSCYDNGRFVTFNKQRGLLSNEISSIHMDRRENLWVGCTRGVSKLDARNYLRLLSTEAPFAGISAAQVATRRFVEPKALYCEYDSADIHVEFSALSLAWPGGIRFRYALDDEDWYESGQWSCRLRHLAPGSHEFRLQAKLEGGPWSAESVLLPIHVNPPFWYTGWFRSVLILAVLACLAGIHSWRARALRKKEREKLLLLQMQHSLSKLEWRAINASLNPHFLFNALNSIQYYFNQGGDLVQANIYLSDFGKLIRMCLDDVHQGTVSLDNEISRLRLYLRLESMRLGARLGWTIDIDPALDVAQIFIPAMLIVPFVENAVWHGISPLKEGGFVRVSAERTPQGLLRICVCDNGIGIAKSKELHRRNTRRHRSIGMALMEERFALLAQTTGVKAAITVSELDRNESARPGTRLEITIQC